MASEITIINEALTKLGEQAILTRTEDSRPARTANRTFDSIRDTMLRQHPWNFAIKRTTIAANSTAPDWGYAVSYNLPPDFLRLLSINNPSELPYCIEGTKILTDISGTLSIRYVSRITDIDSMTFAFREALVARLAMEWAEPLSGTTTLWQQMAEMYKDKLRVAKVDDAQENWPEKIISSTWIDIR